MNNFKVALVLLVAVSSCVRAEFTLQHISTEYLPTSLNPEVFQYNTGAAEQAAVDQNQAIIYVAGLNNVHVVDISDPANPSRPYNIALTPSLNDGAATDVETCGSWVAVSFDDFRDPFNGQVLIYTTYDADAEPPMSLLYTFPVGSMPDMVKFTKDCSRLVVAVEAELRVVDGTAVDPEGQVAIIDFNKLPRESEPTVRIAGFQQFNDRETEYVSRGVRKVYNGQGDGTSTTLSQDLEPEYIAINSDDTIAYIVLQENNAVATVDLNAGLVTELYSFGVKEYNQVTLDASDKDDGINLQPWPVYSLPQPDGVAYVRINDVAYLITANEGGIKDYEQDDGFPFDWSEAQRGNKFNSGDFADSVSSGFINDVSDKERLGRLGFSAIDGQDADGKFENLYSYGSRDFGVYRVTDFSPVVNGGDDLEQRIAAAFPTIFNANPNSNSDTPEESMDTRSDNRGPEPEAVEYGVIDGQTLIFLGLERPGFVAIYSVDDTGSIPEFNFESINYGGGFGKSWEDLYEDRVVRDLDAEDLRFIPASRGIALYDMLAVIGTYSGTIAFYQVVNSEAERVTISQVPCDMNLYSSASFSSYSLALSFISLIVAKLAHY